MKDDGTPFKSVSDNSLETANVINIPKSITAVSIIADRALSNTPALPMKNMVIIVIIAGNLPLQGTKLLVSIAMSRSRGESMIRHPTTPAALHPNPMHMKRCFYALL